MVRLMVRLMDRLIRHHDHRAVGHGASYDEVHRMRLLHHSRRWCRLRCLVRLLRLSRCCHRRRRHRQHRYSHRHSQRHSTASKHRVLPQDSYPCYSHLHQCDACAYDASSSLV
jgi:hypothetical protein